MSGIIHRGSPEHKAHLKGVEMEKKIVEKPAIVAAPVAPVVPPRKDAKPEETKPTETK